MGKHALYINFFFSFFSSGTLRVYVKKRKGKKTGGSIHIKIVKTEQLPGNALLPIITKSETRKKDVF